jgi:Holliday junction DNA helicase RuvA
MIASVRGSVLYVDGDTVVVETGGVGYAVAVTQPVAHSLTPGAEVLLHTHLVVREDAMQLVGFTERAELVVFLALLGVSGVGPKSALGVLSHLSIDQIAAAVAAEDDAPFRRVSGIGPKTAKLIVVQLAGRLAPPPAASTSPTGGGDAALLTQLTAALNGLGWNDRVAQETATSVIESAPATERSVPALLRLALAELGPARGEHVRG